MNIYVGNLSYQVTDEQLNELFAEFGSVDKALVIKDKFTGKSKGFGFVEMQAKESGTQAIEKLDGQMFEGRALRVNEARERERKDSRPSRPAKSW